MSRCEDEKMSRCEDEQMWRWEDVKMRRCEDEQMWRWADVKMRRCEDEQMWRWEDVKMRRCEDEKVWRWEDEIQTPTIGRTLRSDALGNYKSQHQSFQHKHVCKHLCRGAFEIRWPQGTRGARQRSNARRRVSVKGRDENIWRHGDQERARRSKGKRKSKRKKKVSCNSKQNSKQDVEEEASRKTKKQTKEEKLARQQAREADTRASRWQARISKQEARERSRRKKKASYAGLGLSQIVWDWQQVSCLVQKGTLYRQYRLQAAGPLHPSVTLCRTGDTSPCLGWEAASFLSASEGDVGRIGCRQRARSVLHWHAVSDWRRQPFFWRRLPFGASFLSGSLYMYLRCFLLRESQTKTWKHNLFDKFRPLQG